MNELAKDADRAAVLAAFSKQIGWCNRLDAPFSARLLTVLAEDIARGGPAAELVACRAGDPVADALALRLAGAFHALALTDAVPVLTACYPPANEPGSDTLRAAVTTALNGQAHMLREFLASPPQTNEVGRSAVLLGGFLQIAAAYRLPLRLLEIGASAGLNLIWDCYHYVIGNGRWGNPASPVRLEPEWAGPLPLLETPLEVAERAGCDIAPIDLENDDARLRLRAYVWADQPERLARINAAMAVARAARIVVERADAGAWVAGKLAQPTPGRASVLYHSIMWQYMSDSTQAAVRGAITHAGERATPAAPLAWLRFEPSRPDARPELHLTLWPGAQDQRLAVAHPHGKSVQWLQP